jgi:hypothetical protein
MDKQTHKTVEAGIEKHHVTPSVFIFVINAHDIEIPRAFTGDWSVHSNFYRIEVSETADGDRRVPCNRA